MNVRAYRLFQEALERPASQREAFIDEEASGDVPVAAAARGMLRSFEDENTGVGTAVDLPDWGRPREGTVVNGWEIGREIGGGGQGLVYHARKRVRGGDEEAAIKFLDVRPDQLRRFQQERQLLVDFDHPGLVPFIDGGTTAGGTPYVVMEYVVGLSITEYCNRHKLDIRDRLRLFVKLCGIVEYAHRRGVLHRDIKPQNVLVTESKEVRLLDLGIAKLLRPSEGIDEPMTKSPEGLFTKRYASPEQVLGRLVGFETDVYALGLILYELVTGQRPFSDLALDAEDWKDDVLKRQPMPPSRAVLVEEAESNTTESPFIPEATGGSRRRLKDLLAGDLDVVILKALANNPADRFQRVDRLRPEIERYLNGFPVETGSRSGRFRRLYKWSGRHPVMACLLAVSCLALFETLNVGALRSMDYDLKRQDEVNAVRRLHYLIDAGLPRVERGLPPGPESTEARRVLVQAKMELLGRLLAMPKNIQHELDREIVTLGLQCGQEWRNLKNSEAALAASNATVARAEERHNAEPSDRQWRRFYADALQLRMGLRANEGQPLGADADAKQLANLEGGR